MDENHRPFRFTALDIVRFIAAMSVVLYHYSPWLDSPATSILSQSFRFGYLGVPLFFIISGFVIAASAQNRSAGAFAVSRFARLYPAYWAAIGITLLIVFLAKGETENLQTVLANLTMLNDYVDVKDIDGVYWTLQVELKFYACIFLLLLFGVFDQHRVWLTLWLVVTILYALTGQPFFMGWFINPHYSCYFIAGVAFYMIWKNGSDQLLGAILVASIALSIWKAYEQVSGFIDDPDRTTRLIASALVACMFVFFWALTRRKLQVKPRPLYLVLGALTYPIYLLHNRAGKAIIDYGSKHASDQIIALTTILFIIVLSYGVYRFVERPFASPLKRKLLDMIERIEFAFERRWS